MKKKPAGDPPKDANGVPYLTDEYLVRLCEENDQYTTPHLNSSLYLHYKGLHKVNGLEKYYKLKCLWLECNCMKSIEGIDHLVQLRTLYLH
jgi:dynein assembly factor 1, axonemal